MTRLLPSYVGALLIATWLGGCATAQLPPPATEEEKTAAGEAFTSCLNNAAHKLDDGVSDAATIGMDGVKQDVRSNDNHLWPGPAKMIVAHYGMAIALMCSTEYARYRETFGRGMHPQARSLFYQKADRHQLEAATRAVLIKRSEVK